MIRIDAVKRKGKEKQKKFAAGDFRHSSGKWVLHLAGG
jgi:hypothetical protein